MPERIQRRRTKGWKMPENTISVSRPGEFGNPFKIGGYYKVGNGGVGFSWLHCLYACNADSSYTLIETNQQAVDMYREYITNYPLKEEQINKLKGKNLACFCSLDKPCHADVLLEIANNE